MGGALGRIVVLNSKGGCGKSTVATNLAAWYAVNHVPVALMDYDPQGSSSAWLKNRPSSCVPIYGVHAAKPASPSMTRTWQLGVPPETRHVIVDTPASIDNMQMLRFVEKVDAILIPVQPSAPDIHAVTRFVERLLTVGKVRRSGIRVGVLANRVKLNLAVYRGLLKFLTVLEFPLVAQLSDDHAYTQAMSQGLSVFELPNEYGDCDKEEWRKLAEWLAGSSTNDDGRAAYDAHPTRSTV